MSTSAIWYDTTILVGGTRGYNVLEHHEAQTHMSQKCALRAPINSLSAKRQYHIRGFLSHQ